MPISTDAAFEQALQACAAEPIHLIGQVQPHAGLLVFSPHAEQAVLQASSNIAGFLGLAPGAELGCSLAGSCPARPWPPCRTCWRAPPAGPPPASSSCAPARLPSRWR